MIEIRIDALLEERGRTFYWPAEWNPKVLSQLNQTEMPAALQARLAEHYMW